VVELVQLARREGRSLRVHGAGHSVAPAIGSSEAGGLELRLDALDAVHFPSESRVRVGAGCRMGGDPSVSHGFASREHSLAAALARRGRALPNVAGIMRQTLAGFLATGSSGGSTQHDLGGCVRGLRFVDGRGELREIGSGDPLFSMLGVAMGLLGVVTEVELESAPHFDVIGREQTMARAEAPFDLLAGGERGVFAFLEQQPYARILWFPQPALQKLVIWRGRAAESCDYDARTGPPALFSPRPYRALPALFGSERATQRMAALALRLLDAYPSRRLSQAVIDAFLPSGEQTFWDRWQRALPMDGAIDERVLPFDFAELWFSREQAPEALARLDAFHARYELAAIGNFAVELYAGPASPFLMSPGYAQPSLRINFMHASQNRQAAAARFAPIWDLFEDMGPRFHWGKHLPPPPRAAGWIARAWPRLPEFLAARAECDPDGIFLSAYFAERLSLPLPRRAARARAPAALSGASLPAWPLAFELEPVPEDFAPLATRRFSFAVDCHADPEQLFDRMVEMREASDWMEQFVRVERDAHDPEHLFDEHFTFMRIRVRTLRLERPLLWVARVEAASLPLATRLLERVELQRHPRGRTQLCWTMYFDPHPLAAPFENQLRPLFEGLFGRSLQRLGALSERRAGIGRPC
jgi:hypothetical protein